MKYAIACVIIVGITVAILLTTRTHAQVVSTTEPSRLATSRPSTRPNLNNGNNGRNRRDRTGRNNRRNRSATGGSTTNPSGFDTTPTPGQMSDEFAILDSRSLFQPGRISTRGDGGNFSAPQAEDVTVFTGVTITDYQVLAFIEDTTSGSVKQAQIGQQIGQGKITGITLDGLEYQTSTGQKIHVDVGQNMRGVSAFDQIYGVSSSSMVNPSSSDEPTDASTAAMIAKLKLKRQQELAGSGPKATTAPSPSPAR